MVRGFTSSTFFSETGRKKKLMNSKDVFFVVRLHCEGKNEFGL